MPTTPKEASAATTAANRDALARYDLANRQDFADADRDLIAPLPGKVVAADGHVIFDPEWMDYTFTDLDQTWSVRVKRGVLNARQGASSNPQLTVAGPKAALVGALLQPASAAQLADAGKIELDGDQSVLEALSGVFDEFEPTFNIVTP